ncbi:DUF1129 family protein [Isobaculum melis]|uniref:Uncharacterized membrane-anchored protein n=1 Tax=Isobaculum melis TaxID=142588 RepID=A0A1H9R5Y5_9LACT|nr:DUF1129 family protein [Isobaculum melis]SER68136.1 Uncharacterized membrane-anchored protein [Isobaculum melis]
MNKQNQEIKQRIEKNNLLRNQLTNENKVYYEKLLLYIRTVGIFYDEAEIESLLYGILSDVVSAQEHGETAADYLGKDPKEMADTLISKLEKPKLKQKLKLASYIFGISSFFSLIGEFSAAEFKVNPIVFLLNGLLSIIMVYVVFICIHKTVYSTKSATKARRFLNYFYLWLMSCFVLGAFILIGLFSPKILIITIPAPFDLFIIGLLVLAVFGYVLLKRQEEFYPFLPMIFIFALIGICIKLPFGQALLKSTNGIFLLVGTYLVGYLAFFLLNRAILKRENKVTK